MRPYLLKGHSRPLTQVKYNREGDLLVSCAKDLQPCLWFSEDGARIGTYEGHNGAVWTCDMDLDSERLLTASADQTLRLWQLQTGKELFQFRFNEPCRAVKFNVGDTHCALTCDSFTTMPPMVHIIKMSEDLSTQADKPMLSWEVPKGRTTRVFWTNCNRSLITSHDYGFVRLWDVETGKLLLENQLHEEAIQDMQIAADGVQGITASLDKTAKLFDAETLTEIKSYKTGRFVQSAAISPLYDHVVMGGGQDASQVTTTAAKAGGFESRFFHKIFAEEFGNVRGHFGPINSVAFHPSGRSFVTGGEDGYVRMNHFDMDYHTSKFF